MMRLNRVARLSKNQLPNTGVSLIYIILFCNFFWLANSYNTSSERFVMNIEWQLAPAIMVTILLIAGIA